MISLSLTKTLSSWISVKINDFVRNNEKNDTTLLISRGQRTRKSDITSDYFRIPRLFRRD